MGCDPLPWEWKHSRLPLSRRYKETSFLCGAWERSNNVSMELIIDVWAPLPFDGGLRQIATTKKIGLILQKSFLIFHKRRRRFFLWSASGNDISDISVNFFSLSLFYDFLSFSSECCWTHASSSTSNDWQDGFLTKFWIRKEARRLARVALSRTAVHRLENIKSRSTLLVLIEAKIKKVKEMRRVKSRKSGSECHFPEWRVRELQLLPFCCLFQFFWFFSSFSKCDSPRIQSMVPINEAATSCLCRPQCALVRSSFPVLVLVVLWCGKWRKKRLFRTI